MSNPNSEVQAPDLATRAYRAAIMRLEIVNIYELVYSTRSKMEVLHVLWNTARPGQRFTYACMLLEEQVNRLLTTVDELADKGPHKDESWADFEKRLLDEGQRVLKTRDELEYKLVETLRKLKREVTDNAIKDWLKAAKANATSAATSESPAQAVKAKQLAPASVAKSKAPPPPRKKSASSKPTASPARPRRRRP